VVTQVVQRCCECALFNLLLLLGARQAKVC